MKHITFFFCALIAVSSATNITETFFAQEEWSCIQGCYSEHDFSGEIKLMEMALPEFTLIFDICKVIETTQTCAERCNYTNNLAMVKPFEHLCDSETLAELQKHEVCFTDINNGETKTACSQECGGQVDEMAETLHRLIAHHAGVDPNATGVSGPSAAIHNVTIETCRWQKCYARCTVNTIGSKCRDSDPGATVFLRHIYEELGFAYYDDLKSMGLADVVRNMPAECTFMVEPSTIFDDNANAGNPANANVEESEDRNEEEFWKQRRREEEKMWSVCFKKCAADLSYAAEMDQFESINRGGDYAEQFLNLHSMCRANEDMRQCLSRCDPTTVHPSDMKHADALCDKELFLEVQAHEECYSKSRDAQTQCSEQCYDENEKNHGTTPYPVGDTETCSTQKCRMRCHYKIVAEACDDTDPQASKFMLEWFDAMRRGASYALEEEADRGAMEAVLDGTASQCHYFLNKNISLFDENSSVRCSLTHTCTTFLLLFMAFNFFNNGF